MKIIEKKVDKHLCWIFALGLICQRGNYVHNLWLLRDTTYIFCILLLKARILIFADMEETVASA